MHTSILACVLLLTYLTGGNQRLGILAIGAFQRHHFYAHALRPVLVRG